jgi:hypothetical protein
MGLYLTVVLISLIAGLEPALGEEGELLVIWGSAIGLALAHIFSFRIAQVYEMGAASSAGWQSIGAMFGAAFGVAVLATIPYLIPTGRAAPSSVATILLMGVVAVAAYLAARSRGWGAAPTVAYVLWILLLASVVAIVKFFLTH